MRAEAQRRPSIGAESMQPSVHAKEFIPGQGLVQRTEGEAALECLSEMPCNTCALSRVNDAWFIVCVKCALDCDVACVQVARLMRPAR